MLSALEFLWTGLKSSGTGRTKRIDDSEMAGRIALFLRTGTKRPRERIHPLASS